MLRRQNTNAFIAKQADKNKATTRKWTTLICLKVVIILLCRWYSKLTCISRDIISHTLTIYLFYFKVCDGNSLRSRRNVGFELENPMHPVGFTSSFAAASSAALWNFEKNAIQLLSK